MKHLRENGAAESADCREAIFREEFFSPYTQGWGIHEREGLGIKSLDIEDKGEERNELFRD